MSRAVLLAAGCFCLLLALLTLWVLIAAGPDVLTLLSLGVLALLVVGIFRAAATGPPEGP